MGIQENKTFETLSLSFDEWHKMAEFLCSYQYTDGTALSFDAGLRGEFKDIKCQAKGLINKKGDYFRFSVDYGKPPIELNLSDQLNILENYIYAVTNVSKDEVSNKILYLTYEPKKGKLGGSVKIWERKQALDHRKIPWPELHIINPLSIPNPGYANPLQELLTRSKSKAITCTEKIIDATHIEATIAIANNDKEKPFITRTVLFWTEPSIPVITKISQISIGSERTVESIIEASDFILCNNISVPRCIRKITKLSDDEKIIFREWMSDDLGKNKPTENDFVVTIPKDVIVSGLKKDLTSSSFKEGQIRHIDLSNITINDLCAAAQN